mgnify:FL=1
MSIIFRPKIPREFEGCSKLQKREVLFYGTKWTASQVSTVIKLRALNCTYAEMSEILDSSPYKIYSCIANKKLEPEITRRRKEHLEEALK